MEVNSMLGQLSDNEFLNNLDNFFLVFISAWMGVRIDEWSDNGRRLILLIAMVLAYAIILATVRDWISNDKRRDFRTVISETMGLFFVVVLGSAYLLVKGFILVEDINVYCHIGALWAFMAIVPPLLSKAQASTNKEG
jgi:hypothetical protein